jgi:hypothetical protein
LFALSLFTNIVAINGGWLESGFPYMNMADSVVVAREGQLAINPFPSGPGSSLNNVANVRSTRLVVILLPVFLSQVTGIPVTSWTFFPLAGLLLPLIGYLVARTLLSSELWGFAFGVYLALEPQALLRNYNMNIQGFGLFFFMAIFLIVIKTFAESERTRRNFLLFMVFFVMTVLTYYSSEFYSLVFVFIMMLLVYLNHRGDFAKKDIIRNFTIVGIVITLTFEPIVNLYSQNLLTGGAKNMFEVIINFVNDILRVIGLRQATPTTSTTVSTPFYLLLVNGFLLAMIIFPILLAPFFIRRKNYTHNFFVALFITGIFDLIAYNLLEGHVDLKFVYLFFPVCAMIILKAIYEKRPTRLSKTIRNLFLITLVALVGLRFGLYASGPYVHFQEFNPHNLSQFDVPVKYAVSPNIFLTDNVAGGKVLVSFASQGVYGLDSAYQFASIESVAFLYSGAYSDLEAFRRSRGQTPIYILISSYALEKNFPAQGWTSYPPFANYSIVLNSPQASLIYAGLDSTVLIIR